MFTRKGIPSTGCPNSGTQVRVRTANLHHKNIQQLCFWIPRGDSDKLDELFGPHWLHHTYWWLNISACRAQLLLMSLHVPESGSADDETKRLSGIFKILGYTLLHLLSGVRVTNTRPATNISGRELLCKFCAVHGHLQLLAQFAALVPPSRHFSSTSIDDCSKTCFKDLKAYLIFSIRIMAGCSHT